MKTDERNANTTNQVALRFIVKHSADDDDDAPTTSMTVRAPRCASLGGFLSRDRARLRAAALLGLPGDDQEEDVVDGLVFRHCKTGRVIASTMQCGTVSDGFKSGVDDALELCVEVGRRRRQDGDSGGDGDGGWNGVARECRANFFNSLKEATYAAFASAAKVMSMSNESMDALYDAAVTGDAGAIRRAEGISNDELRMGSRKRAVAPVRLYVVASDGNFADTTYLSAPASVEDAETTIGEALTSFGVDVGAVKSIVSQGIELDASFHLERAYEALRGVDGFLYLIVELNSS